MIGHLIDEKSLKRFYEHLKGRGILNVIPYSKGNTSLVFVGEREGEKILIKLQRRDSSRRSLRKEAEILKFLKGKNITPELFFTGNFEGLDYLVRHFAEGEPILYANIEREHLIEIGRKMHELDKLGIDHGQVQGGKHILVGDRVWIIDFEKASLERKPRNLTSAMAMLFLNENQISKRIITKFGLDEKFLEELKTAVKFYKRKKNPKEIFELLSSL